MTASIVRVDHLERLEQAIIGGRREVARDLGAQDVVVRVADGKLLHRLQVQLENNWSVGCRRRSPVGWVLKWRRAHSGERCPCWRAWATCRWDRLMGHSSQLAIAVQVNAERHNKWLAGGMIRRVKIQWTNNALGFENHQREQTAQKKGPTGWWSCNTVPQTTFSFCSHMSLVSQVCLWSYST